MLFNSVAFLIFCPLVFLIYWLTRGVRAQNSVLLAGSLVFYGWWDIRFLSLISMVFSVSYFAAILIEKARARGRKGRPWLALCLLVTLGTLGLFKYYNFFAGNAQFVLSCLALKADLPTLHLILPVGISFYTFQALGYCIDVYRGDTHAERDALDYFTFIAFFPQLVAGPIERASHLLPQIKKARTFSYASSVQGLRLMLWGFFKKCVVADSCATVVDTVFAASSGYSWLELLAAAFLFTVQIYADFSGYCDIAVGTARLFGVELVMNFRLPYFSANIKEFWRRWHVSLMTWFRDYVYIPLGGSRGGYYKTVRNVFCVFLLSGLWHGAMWTFVLWGAWHAVWMTCHAIMERKVGGHLPFSGKPYPGVAATFLVVMLGWIFFRAPSVEAAFRYMGALFSPLQSPLAYQFSRMPLFWAAILLTGEFIGRRSLCPVDVLPQGGGKNRIMRWSVYYILLLLLAFFANGEQEFIYFQF